MIDVPRVELNNTRAPLVMRIRSVQEENLYLVENHSGVLLTAKGDEIFKVLAPIIKSDGSNPECLSGAQTV